MGSINQLSLFPIEPEECKSEETIDISEFSKERPSKITTKRGDLWQIDNHRLLCGDSSDSHDVKKLLDGNKVQLIHMDPPYNVKVQPQSKDSTSAKSRKLSGDYISDLDFLKLLYLWFIYAGRALEPGRAFYIWGGYSNILNYLPTIRATGLFFSQAIIWVKSMSVFTRKDFMGKHEICFYGWKKGAPHKYLGPNNITDVWEVHNVPRKQMIHLTEKPVEIPLRAIEYSSQPGERVLDLFGGSGSTLVAAHTLDRICYLMEIDPWYCDIILQRCKELGMSIEKV